jgi:hypothetical protein
VSVRAGRSGGERTGGFIGERAYGRIPAARAQAAATMLSVPAARPSRRSGAAAAAGVGSGGGCQHGGAVAASCRRLFFVRVTISLVPGNPFVAKLRG